MSEGKQVIDLGYTPRKAFLPFHKRTKRFAVVVAHRRFGKSYGLLRDLVGRALNFQKRAKDQTFLKNPRFGFVCPTKTQAKDVAWLYLMDFTRNLPGLEVNQTELWVRFQCASGERAQIRLYGADDPDKLRGLYFDGVVLDEYGDMKPDMYTQVIRYTISDKDRGGGWVVFSGTPKGKNDFYKRVQLALKDPSKYFYLCIKASENPELDAAELEDIKSEMEPEEWEQELECSFESRLSGSFYGKQMISAEAQSKIRYAAPRPGQLPMAYDPREKVSCAMDIGRNDAAVIGFWQVINGEVNFFDYWEESGHDAAEVCDLLNLKPYDYETIWLPHDALHRTFASGKSVMDTFLASGLPARKAPNPDAGNRVMHGIDAVRKFLRLWPFTIDVYSNPRTTRLIDALKNYSRKLVRATGLYSTDADHNEWSHGADMFRYAVLSIKDSDLARSKERWIRRLADEKEQALNTSRLTIDEAFKARELQMLEDSSNRDSDYY